MFFLYWILLLLVCRRYENAADREDAFVIVLSSGVNTSVSFLMRFEISNGKCNFVWL